MASRPLRAGDPRRLGNYRLLARLGSGGMGTVFLGRDQAGQHVAVKTIRPEYANNEEFRARFRSEVTRARQVPSFCTAAVLDADPDNETPYLVVEYVDGPSLQEVVDERGPVSAGDLYSIAVGVAAALTAIHGAGVIHRDLKPGNVLLSLGLPKVIDFGIARALEGTSRHTRPGHFVGTVDYMAPERLDSSVGPVTPATDIFAWGAVIAFAGTGRIPFEGESTVATAARILTKAPDLRGLPDSLTGLVGRALSKDPHDRPTAHELVQELLAVSPARGQAPADPQNRPLTGRFDARELLDQVVAEGKRRPAAAPPERPDRPARRTAGGVRAGKQSNDIARSGGTARRLVYTLGALLVASVTAATVAYATTPDRRDDPSVDLKIGPATETAAAPSAQGPSFTDPLDKPGRFRESAADHGGCAFREHRLHARVKAGSTYQCAGPDDVFGGDQSITVKLTLDNSDSCAMLWFRYQDGRGYQLSACSDVVEIERLGGAFVPRVGRTQSTVLTPDETHKLNLLVVSGHATVSVDGKPVLRGAVDAPDLASGRIRLGVFNTSGKNAAEVSFADLDVRGI